MCRSKRLKTSGRKLRSVINHIVFIKMQLQGKAENLVQGLVSPLKPHKGDPALKARRSISQPEKN